MNDRYTTAFSLDEGAEVFNMKAPGSSVVFFILAAISLTLLLFMVNRGPDWKLPAKAEQPLSKPSPETGTTIENQVLPGPSMASREPSIADLDNEEIPGYTRMQPLENILNASRHEGSQDGVFASPTLSEEVKVEAPAKPLPSTLDEALEECRATGQPMLVIFTNAFDSMCRALENEALGDQGFKRIVRGRAGLAIIDMDRRPGDARKLGIMIPPSFLVMGADGQEIGRKEGYFGVDDLLGWFRNQFH